MGAGRGGCRPISEHVGWVRGLAGVMGVTGGTGEEQEAWRFTWGFRVCGVMYVGASGVGAQGLAGQHTTPLHGMPPFCELQ